MVISHKLLLLTVTCTVVSTTYGYRLPASIPTCFLGDDVCVAKSISHMILNRDVYPELKIPTLQPYIPTEKWVLRTRATNLPIKFNINTSNMKISGLKQLIVHQFAGFRPDLRNTRIPSKISLPIMKVSADFTASMQLLMLNVKPEGVLTMDLMDVDVPISYDGQFIRRNGKDYYVITGVKAHLNISRMKLNAKCKNIPGWINDAMNNLLNDNWKILKAELDDSLDLYIGNIIRSILQPILNKVAVEDFYRN